MSELMSRKDVLKARACKALLPPPAPEVVGQLIDVIDALHDVLVKVEAVRAEMVPAWQFSQDEGGRLAKAADAAIAKLKPGGWVDE